MSPEEYGMLCDRILTDTMQYITTDRMRKPALDKSYIGSQDPIYISAAISSSPITIVYTPAGSGKSALIADRVSLLEKSGTLPQSIAVLSMNIAKAKQMKESMPGVCCMTFSDFTHEIFTANFPGHKLVDKTSLLNTLKLQEQTPFRQALIEKMSITNSRDRASLLTIFVNNYLPEIEQELSKTGMSEYELESMICQNRIYQMAKNPFMLDEIIINGVHNMPLHTLCAILEYASMYGCRLFITGMPNETIYDFNMAYGEAINMISAYMGRLDIGIIRLQSTRMKPDVYNTLVQDPKASVSASSVNMASIISKYIPDIHEALKTAVSKEQGYIDSRLKNKEKLLVLGSSKAEIADIKKAILDTYLPLYPNLAVTDLTEIQAPQFLWGTLLTKYAHSLKETMPNGINLPEIYGKLWDILAAEMENAESPAMMKQYENQKRLLKKELKPEWTQEELTKQPVKQRIQFIINKEADAIQEYNRCIRENTKINTGEADITFSTIYSAVDLRCENVILYCKNRTNRVNENIYRVGLSRTNSTEYLIFLNEDNFDIPVQQYLKHHLTE